jgi:hypothetical protein
MFIQCTYSQREEWDGERVEGERRLEGQQFTKLGRKYQHDWTDCISSLHVYIDKHLPQSPLTDHFFMLDDDILLRRHFS